MGRKFVKKRSMDIDWKAINYRRRKIHVVASNTHQNDNRLELIDVLKNSHQMSIKPVESEYRNIVV